ncbi:MAG: hypothetical protein CMN25_06125 [Salinicola sp.]|uniref:DUF883 C-terminal domain-containing protein n=1 Tax=Salinicola sp. TaxID=1978524 RepID=UPI000C88FA73|nr:DUF883 C-terminal domain-containing protein [Salinicola sp.]MAM56895.1 hypothetical protein [Salinicola sp.]NRB57501.1 hypothetical protein [Salinicola sp.]
MSLFHRDDKEDETNRIDEDMAAAAERAPRLGDDPIREEPALTSQDDPLEESIDEPPPHATAYLPQDSWANRSRQRLDEQISDTCESCDEFVQRKPWQSVGIAALGGALLTLMLSRR